MFLDNLSHVIDVGHVRSVLRVPDSWAISFLYLCCSGSFLGFAFAFGQVLVHNFVAAGKPTHRRRCTRPRSPSSARCWDRWRG
ncbi:putative integral membrane nitrite extrusion protein [Mycobacterium kansasii]|uniref:Putative integral membrane nitrite extrusion protein n=1 Tax=Mycobacterium kansasii TaxID=1768 RepID=A0A1V3XN05_MYCKA|nr:putative integral membrane nitrite extrusion protein [Mycobacterium kansasii]